MTAGTSTDRVLVEAASPGAYKVPRAHLEAVELGLQDRGTWVRQGQIPAQFSGRIEERQLPRTRVSARLPPEADLGEVVVLALSDGVRAAHARPDAEGRVFLSWRRELTFSLQEGIHGAST